MTRIFAISLLGILLNACVADVQMPKPEEAEQEIRDRWDSFIASWEAEDASGCAAMYQVNGLNIPPESSIKEGREAIEAFYAFLFELNQQSTYRHTIKDLQVLGDQVLELGEFQVDWVRNDSTAWTFKARSMTHWEKGEDGQWEIEKFMFNNPPEE